MGGLRDPEAARPFSIIPIADHYVFQSNEADVLREMNAFLGVKLVERATTSDIRIFAATARWL